jgi:antitoxin HicB
MTTASTEQFEVRIRPLPEQEGGGFEAIVPQFSRSAVGYGESQTEAMDELRLSVGSLFDHFTSENKPIPSPIPSRPWLEYSGKFTVRVPKSLHYKLDMLAEEEGVSLNQFVVNLLASGAEHHHCMIRPLSVYPATINHQVNYNGNALFSSSRIYPLGAIFNRRLDAPISAAP